MGTFRQEKGFTLIELLIVVAIIAILAAIAVPNFLEAQVRSKVARVENDLRAIGVALEAYRLDWSSLPVWQSWENAPGGAAGRREMRPGQLWLALTTPVAYLTSAIVDAFVAIGVHSQSGHAGDGDLLLAHIHIGTGWLGPGGSRDPRTHWLAASYGPDSADDTNLDGAYPYTRDCCPYDPTNGTTSWGDIYRHGNAIPVNFLAGHSDMAGSALIHGSNANNGANRLVENPYRWSH